MQSFRVLPKAAHPRASLNRNGKTVVKGEIIARKASALRRRQVYLVAASRLMCYLSRGQLGIVLPFLTSEYHLTAMDHGYLMSCYASGYILTQIVGGLLADTYGGYAVISIAIAATVLCCISAHVLVNYGTHIFGIPFICMGLFQGTIMPAGNVMMAKWVLPSERSWASAITGIGACMGTLLINLVAAPIASRIGWAAVFQSVAWACSMFLVIWLWLACSSPDTCSSLSSEELSLLQHAGLATSSDDTKTGLAKQAPEEKRAFLNLSLFLHPAVWAVIVAHFVQNSQTYFAEWLPTFYRAQLGVDADSASIFLTIVASVELPARAASKALQEWMDERGSTLLWCRRAMSLQGFGYHLVLCALAAVFLVSGMTSPITFTILFAMSKAVQAFHAGGYFANYLDLTQNYAGMLTGIGNTLASVAGIVVPQFVAFNLQSSAGNWLPVFLAMIILNAVAMAMLVKFMSTDCLDDAQTPSSDCLNLKSSYTQK